MLHPEIRRRRLFFLWNWKYTIEDMHRGHIIHRKDSAGKCGLEIIMGKYFGTDGFRGEANVNLTVEHAFKVGRFLGWYYGRNHKAQIVIGKDTRRSSYMFEYSWWQG